MRDAWPALRGTICLIGEGMVELSRGAAGWNVGYGGDTVNIAVHLARFGRSVAYATALGTDPLSDQLRAGDAFDAGYLDATRRARPRSGRRRRTRAGRLGDRPMRGDPRAGCGGSLCG